MRRRDLLMNLTLICLLWFSFAFTCGGGNEGGSSNSGGRTQTSTAPTTSTAPAKKGPPTEQDVRDAITRGMNDAWYHSYRNIVVTFDSPVRVVSVSRLGVTDAMYYYATVDWTLQCDNGEQIYITHYKGGQVEVTQDDYTHGEWKYEGVHGGEEITEHRPMK